jgi:hypothetical protein
MKCQNGITKWITCVFGFVYPRQRKETIWASKVDNITSLTTSNLRIDGGVGSNLSETSFLFHKKKVRTHCLVLVGSRDRF